MRKTNWDSSESNLKKEISRYFKSKREGARADNLVRLAEDIKTLAQNYEGSDTWINKFKNGEVVTNSFGKKLYFKFN